MDLDTIICGPTLLRQTRSGFGHNYLLTNLIELDKVRIGHNYLLTNLIEVDKVRIGHKYLLTNLIEADRVRIWTQVSADQPY